MAKQDLIGAIQYIEERGCPICRNRNQYLEITAPHGLLLVTCVACGSVLCEDRGVGWIPELEEAVGDTQ